MTNYTLSFSFSSANVISIIDANQAVTIVRSVVSNATTSDGRLAPVVAAYLPVAWLQFSPSNQNIVTWNDAVSVLSTTTTLQPGQVIQPNATTDPPIELGLIYVYSEDVIQTNGLTGDAEAYNLANGQGATSNLGLGQQGTIDGDILSSSLAAIVVLNNETATFSPGSIYSVFLETNTGSGAVISEVPDQALPVTLDAAAPSATIAFDGANNTFYLDAT